MPGGTGAEPTRVFREVLAEKREVLGARHPDTLNAMGNLASTLREGGEHEEAEAMERERRDLEA